jgi:fused signal recognition particle receptor
MRCMSEPDEKKPRAGFFGRLKQRLNKGAGLRLGGKRKLDAELEEELETQLLMADVGLDATERVLQGLKKRLKRSGADDDAGIRIALRDSIAELLADREQALDPSSDPKPFVVLIVGVNGSGKTTTIGKLAHEFKARGLEVMLAAGDTFRAAAIEQLQAWGERNDVPVIAQQPGADPAAVIYDAMEAAKARDVDVLLADTAGRLQNKAGLMDELAKIVRVIKRLDAAAPHETMLVLDASLGQNAVNQAREFHKTVGLTGITMTKLDGGAKGGVLLALSEEFELPFRFIGIGEGIDDMDVFDAGQYATALVGESDS